MNIEHRTLNAQRRIMHSVYLKMTEQHAAQAPALRERNHPSKFHSAERFGRELRVERLVAGCGSLLIFVHIHKRFRMSALVLPMYLWGMPYR